MSVIPQYWLYCDDGIACGTQIAANNGEFHYTKKQARAYAKLHGWVYRKGKDICELCLKARAEKGEK